ncbi:uncharacterized protein LOC135372678 [Ornithodoros turicata]|uniref:uncharacterized protein LOC135372678 n=1 Tax=Ornithodoros turicata TaxID=34597 RepID=UPI0031392DD9
MVQLVAFITGLCTVAAAHAASQRGSFITQEGTAVRALTAMKHMMELHARTDEPITYPVYKLVKSTSEVWYPCIYVALPRANATEENPTSYLWGYKENDKWTQGIRIYNVEEDAKYHSDIDENSTSEFPYVQRGVCEVGVSPGEYLDGTDDVELWMNLNAKSDEFGAQCCEGKFKQALQEQNKTLNDVREIDAGCDPYPTLK